MTRHAVDAVLLDLLMAVMDSPSVWAGAAGDRSTGLAWRDAATRLMARAGAYRPYEGILDEAAARIGLGPNASAKLMRHWASMDPWPDAAALQTLELPYGFVTNSSRRLAALAAQRSGLEPALVLSAEDAGWYKPQPAIYREACERIGAAPERTLFVAGSPYDAEGARAAGLRALFVRRRSDQAEPTGIRSIGSLRDVAEVAG